MRVDVNFDRCQSNAICMEVAPAVFQVDDNGFLSILNETPDESMRELLNEAVRSCPTQAISLIDE